MYQQTIVADGKYTQISSETNNVGCCYLLRNDILENVNDNGFGDRESF